MRYEMMEVQCRGGLYLELYDILIDILESVLCEVETHSWFVTHVPVQAQKGQRELHHVHT